MFDDEFEGQGGSYLIDPLTGKRTRIPEEGEEPVLAKPANPKQKKTDPAQGE